MRTGNPHYLPSENLSVEQFDKTEHDIMSSFDLFG